MNSDHRRNGLIFVGVCGALGLSLFLLESGKDMLTRPAAEPTEAPSDYAVPATYSSRQDVETPQHPEPEDTTYPDASDAEQTAQTEPEITASATILDSGELESGARAFVSQYFDAAQQNEQSSLPWMIQHYADTVRYFDVVKSRDAIVKDKLAYLKRWPTRSYTIDPSSEVVECDNAKGLCRVSGMMDWQVFSAERGASASGRSSFMFITLTQNNLVTIVSETRRPP